MRQGELSGQPISIPALSFPTRGITIRGVSVGRWAGLPEPVRTADIDAAISLARTDAAEGRDWRHAQQQPRAGLAGGRRRGAWRRREGRNGG